MLIDNGDNKTASKAIYNSETEEISLVVQDKKTQISNKANFEASKERKTGSKKKSQSSTLKDLEDDIISKSDEVGSSIALDKKGEGLNKSFKSLLNKIAYAIVSKASSQYISDLKSELNGLIKVTSKTSKSDVMLKKKIDNIIARARC